MRARDSLHLTDFVNIMNEASEPENLLLREKVSYQVEMTGSYHTRWAAVGRLLDGRRARVGDRSGGFFGGHLAPVGRQMSIGRSVPGGLWFVFVGGGGVFDCRLSGVDMLSAIYICIYTCLGIILDSCTL